jgi:hypothetical protein
VSGLCHGEATEQSGRGDVWKKLVMASGAEVIEGAAKKSKLDASLDHQTEIKIGEGFKARDEWAQILFEICDTPIGKSAKTILFAAIALPPKE